MIWTHWKNLPPGLVDTPSCQGSPGPAISLPLAKHVTPNKSFHLSATTAGSHLHQGHDNIQPPLPATDDITMMDDNALQTPGTLCFQVCFPPPLMKCRSTVKSTQSLGKLILICKMPSVHATGKELKVFPTSGRAPAGQMSFYWQVKDERHCLIILHIKLWTILKVTFKKTLATINCVYVEETNTCVLPDCF